MTEAPPPPGWYPSPYRGDSQPLRYWDGCSWSATSADRFEAVPSWTERRILRTVVVGVLVATAVAVGALLGVNWWRDRGHGHFDGDQLGRDIAASLTERAQSVDPAFQATLVVQCPDATIKQGGRFVCDLVGYPGGVLHHVVVKVINNGGDYQFRATG